MKNLLTTNKEPETYKDINSLTPEQARKRITELLNSEKPPHLSELIKLNQIFNDIVIF